MSEIVAMVFSFVVAIVMELVVKDQLLSHEKLIIGVLLTSAAWIITALFTKPTDDKILISFYKTIRPHPMGWKPVVAKALTIGAIIDEHTKTGRLSTEILMMSLGCIGVYALLFGMGYVIYGQTINAVLALMMAGLSGLSMRKLWVNIG